MKVLEMQDTLKMKVGVLILILVSITLTLIFASKILSIRDNSYYPSNLFISDFALASLPKSEVPGAINDFFSNQKLTIIMPANKVELDLKDSGISFNVSATMQEAEAANHHFLSSITNRAATDIIIPQYDWDEAVLNNILSTTIDNNIIPPIDAQVVFQNNEDIHYITHKNGYSIDKEMAIRKIKTSLAKGNLLVEVEAQERQPQITLTDVRLIKDILGVATQYNVNLNNWEKLVVIEIDDTIILPGDSFNLNDVWLKNDIDYKNTSNIKSIINSMFMKIDYIENLTYEVTTNTIANNLPSPILINLEVNNNVLWLSIIGTQEDIHQEIVIIEDEEVIPPAIIKKADKGLAPGEQRMVPGKDTIIVKTYQVTKQGDKIKAQVLLDEKKQLGYDTIIYEGYGTIDK